MAFSNIQLIEGPDISRPTLEITLGATEVYTVAILNETGAAVDLADYVTLDPAPAPQPGGFKDLPITNGIVFIAAEYQGQIKPSVIRHCTVSDAAEGLVTLALDASNFSKPGVYLGELLLVHEGSLVKAYKMYLDVQATLAYVTNGPLSIAEVRLWARDTYPTDNFLLDEVEFKDAEIVAAIRRAVDIWNSTTPMLRHYTYTASSFPFRSQWIDITLALLMGIAATSYLRNWLPYQAAGVTVDDKNKYQQYMQLSQQKLEEFKAWAVETKLQINVQQCWGSSRISAGGLTNFDVYRG